MRWSQRRSIRAGAWLLSLVVANYVGGVIGFYKGFSARMELSGADAMQTVTVLTQLREGDSPEAIALLESELDSHILSSVSGGNSADSLYNPIGLLAGNKDTNLSLLSEVVPYRDQYPSMLEDGIVRQRLMEALEAYRAARRSQEGQE